MPIKRDSIFNALIETCNSYEAIPKVTIPGNYYHQVRNIRRQAIEAEPNDASTLGRLTSDLERVWYMLNKEQREFFDKHHADTQRKKIEGC
jgi:hypothetical protein